MQDIRINFIGITYEDFIATTRKHTEDPEYLRWIKYLEDRYIVCNDTIPATTSI